MRTGHKEIIRYMLKDLKISSSDYEISFDEEYELFNYFSVATMFNDKMLCFRYDILYKTLHMIDGCRESVVEIRKELIVKQAKKIKLLIKECKDNRKAMLELKTIKTAC